MPGNRHLQVSLLVAPLLALLAWYAVDFFIAEQPHAARPGASYPLIVQPGCRRPSGRCVLANEAFELVLDVSYLTANRLEVELESRFALRQVALAAARDSETRTAPLRLSSNNDERTHWGGQLEAKIDANSKLQIAAIAGGATYYAEVPVTFFYIEQN